MITPAQYEHKLSEMDFGILDRPGAAREDLQTLNGQLREMVQDINREVQVLRAQYQARISSANAGGTSRVLVSNKQSASERRRSEQVERLQNERDAKIQPYLDVREKLEGYLSRLETLLAG